MKEILLTRFFLASFKLKVRREELQEEEDGVTHVEGLIVVKCKKIIRNTNINIQPSKSFIPHSRSYQIFSTTSRKLFVQRKLVSSNT